MSAQLLAPICAVIPQVTRQLRSHRTPTSVHVITGPGEAVRRDLLARLAYYAPSLHPEFAQKLGYIQVISLAPVLVASHEYFRKSSSIKLARLVRATGSPYRGVYDVDANANHLDGWEWATLAAYLDSFGGKQMQTLQSARQQFKAVTETLRQERRSCAYIFGTGTSLEHANERDWSDGYRIVCNTIVRDPVLWHHIEPDFIVAGDAIYHFGHTPFAQAFRRDLEARLTESRTLFLYPALFDPLVKAQLAAALHERCIPVPTGGIHQLNIDLCTDFRLPNFGNVLLLLLLPLACTLSRKVRLWGFDGRAPTDKYFWSNSTKHSYPELFDTLLKAHPAFFEHHVPKVDPGKYSRTVHGDELDKALSSAEAEGWEFVMLHKTWTAALAKRLRE